MVTTGHVDRYLVVDQTTDQVVNVALWDGTTDWPLVEGLTPELEATSVREVPQSWIPPSEQPLEQP